MRPTDKFTDPTYSGLAPDGWGIYRNGVFYPPVMGGADDDGTDGDKGSDGAGDGDGSTEGDNSDGTSTDKGDGTEGDKGGDEKTLTQKQVDEIVSREKAKAARGKIDPKSLGFTTAKEAQDFVEAMKKKADEDKSADEKALEEAITEAKAEATAAVLEKANERLTRAEFKVQASGHKVAFIDDAYEIVQKLDIWEGVEVDDDGNVTGFDDAFFEELEKAKPYLFKAEGDDDGKGSDIGAGRRNSGKADRTEELKEVYPALRANG